MILKLAVILDPFLGKSSVNMCPREWLRIQRVERGVAYAVRAVELIKKRNGENSSVDSWQKYWNLEGRT
jgi:hypothetical protein